MKADLFSLGEGSLTNYSSTLKSRYDGRQLFFRICFRTCRISVFVIVMGFCPNVSLETTNGGFPKTLTIDYGTGLELANGRTLSGENYCSDFPDLLLRAAARGALLIYWIFQRFYQSFQEHQPRTRTNDSIKREFSTQSKHDTDIPRISTTITRTEKKMMTWLAGEANRVSILQMTVFRLPER